MAEGSINVKIDDFSGGISDFPFNPADRTHQTLDNFLITDDRKAVVCPGSRLVDPSLDQVEFVHPNGQINDLFYAKISGKDKLFVRIKDKLFTMDDETLEIYYDQASPPFYAGDLIFTKDSTASFASVDGHVYAVASEVFDDNMIASLPIKMYRVPAGQFEIVNAGMPEVVDDPDLLANMLSLANEIKSKFNEHIITADHSGSSGAINSPDATNSDTLFTLLQDIREKYRTHIGSSPINSSHVLAVDAGATNLCSSFDYYAQTFNPPETNINTGALTSLIPLLNAMKMLFNLHLSDITSQTIDATGEIQFLWLHPSQEIDGVFADTIVLEDIRKIANFYLPLGEEGEPTKEVFSEIIYGEYTRGLIAHFIDTTTHCHNFFPHDTVGTPTKIFYDDYYNTANIISDIDMIKMVYQSAYFYYIHIRIKTSDAYYHKDAAEIDGTDPAELFTIFSGMIYPDLSTVFGKEFLYEIMTLINAAGAALTVHAHSTVMHQTDTTVQYLYPTYTADFVTPSLAFLFSRKYTTFDGSVILDRGAPYIVNYKAVSAADILPDLFNMFVLEDAKNWPIESISLEIYKLSDGATGYFYLGSIPYNATDFPTKTFNVNMDNTSLITRQQLYTDDGNAPNNAPPKCMTITRVGKHLYYGGVIQKDANGVLQLTDYIYQSKAENYDAVPGDFYVRCPEQWSCQGKVRDNLIVITEKAAYRLDGKINDVGQGSPVLEEISSTVGGVSHQGAVEAGDMLVFAGTDGFYLTDGYKVKMISRHLRERYRKIIANDAQGISKGRLIKGTYNQLEKRIYWCVAEDSDNYDAMWVLDLSQPISEANEAACFTIKKGNSIKPSAASTWKGKNLVRGDIDGWVFMEEDSIFSDPDINRETGELTGARQHIEYELLSGLNDFGDNEQKKYGTKTVLDIKNNGGTSVSVVPTYTNDNGRVSDDLHEINYDSQNGDPLGIIHTQRKISAKGLRFHSRQLGLKPDSLKVYSSEDYAQVIVIAGKILELKESKVWPSDVLGMTIYLSTDGFDEGYQILERISDSRIKVRDLNTLLPSPGTESDWSVEQFPLTERIEILSFGMSAEPIGIRRNNYSKGENKAQ